jgi:hypothetical protein
MSKFDRTPYGFACSECGNTGRRQVAPNAHSKTQKAGVWFRCRCGNITPGWRGRSGEQVASARQNAAGGAGGFTP